MSTPLDPGTRAFRRWLRHLHPTEGLALAEQRTGVGRRRLQRIYSGAAPLPAGLAAELADQCADAAIAAELRTIAQENVNG